MTRKTAEKIQSRFTEIGTEIDITEITQRLDDLVGRFKVPLPEAERSVVSYFLRENGVSSDDYYKSARGESETTSVADIDKIETWVDLKVVVTKLWENVIHESIMNGKPMGTVSTENENNTMNKKEQEPTEECNCPVREMISVMEMVSECRKYCAEGRVGTLSDVQKEKFSEMLEESYHALLQDISHAAGSVPDDVVGNPDNERGCPLQILADMLTSNEDIATRRLGITEKQREEIDGLKLIIRCFEREHVFHGENEDSVFGGA